jgi:hypothetical protein
MKEVGVAGRSAGRRRIHTWSLITKKKREKIIASRTVIGYLVLVKRRDFAVEMYAEYLTAMYGFS